MAAVPPESVAVICEALGVRVRPQDGVAQTLSQALSHRLSALVLDAVAFMHHSKRNHLTPHDVNAALQARSHERLYGYSAREPLHFARHPTQADLFFTQDQEVELQSLLLAPMPPLPRLPSLQVHWLAVDGTQPNIPQNPELVDPLPPALAASGPVELPEPSTAATPNVKPPAKHVLSRELQTYFAKVTEAVSGANEAYRIAALSSLREDRGIHPLVPYIARHVGKELLTNINDDTAVTNLLRLVDALLRNPHAHPELYLHQFLSAVLTCVLGRKVGSDGGWEVREFSAKVAASMAHRYGATYADIPPRLSKTLVAFVLDPNRSTPAHVGALRAMRHLATPSALLAVVPHLCALVATAEGAAKGDDKGAADEVQHLREAVLDVAVLYLNKAYIEAEEPERKRARTEQNSTRKVVGDLLAEAPIYYKDFLELFGDALVSRLQSSAADYFASSST